MHVMTATQQQLIAYTLLACWCCCCYGNENIKFHPIFFILHALCSHPNL